MDDGGVGIQLVATQLVKINKIKIAIGSYNSSMKHRLDKLVLSQS